jgi:hypothetical protein
LVRLNCRRVGHDISSQALLVIFKALASVAGKVATSFALIGAAHNGVNQSKAAAQ